MCSFNDANGSTSLSFSCMKNRSVNMPLSKAYLRSLSEVLVSPGMKYRVVLTVQSMQSSLTVLMLMSMWEPSLAQSYSLTTLRAKPISISRVLSRKNTGRSEMCFAIIRKVSRIAIREARYMSSEPKILINLNIFLSLTKSSIYFETAMTLSAYPAIFKSASSRSSQFSNLVIIRENMLSKSL